MNWKPGWGYWYNLLGPGLAVASVGVMLGHGRKALPPRAVLYGAAASLLGLAMLFKWVNRSIDILWSLNGGLVAVVACGWFWLGWRALSDRLAKESRPGVEFARRAAAAATLAGLVVLAVRLDWDRANSKYQGGSSSPVVRGRTAEELPQSDQCVVQGNWPDDSPVSNRQGEHHVICAFIPANRSG